MAVRTLQSIALFVICLFTTPAIASHVAGGNIEYVCLDPLTNTYQINFTIWRDCQGNQAPPSFSLAIRNNCTNTISNNVILQGDSNYNGGFNGTYGGTEVSQLCDQILPQSTCGNGSYAGYQEYTYTGLITLNSALCTDWTVYTTLCCRNNVDNIVNPGNTQSYFSADINLSQNTCNNSPTFNAQPIPYYCAGQTINYNPGVQEIDGDSLVFSLTTPQHGVNGNITYPAGYNLAEPFGPGVPITFDPATGQLSCTPTAVGRYVINYSVCEYRNGVLLGCVLREFQVIIQACNNQTPYLTGGGIQNLTGGATQIDGTSIELCPGELADFDIVFEDSLIGGQVDGDSITITTNLGVVVPNATITITNGNPATLHVNLIASNSLANFTSFSVEVEDDACPVPGLGIYQFDITKKPSVIAHSDITLCDVNDTAFVQATGADTFTWSLISGDPIIPNVTMSDTTGTLGANVWFYPSVTSSYLLEGNNTPYNCATTDTLNVIINPELEISLDTLLICMGDTVDLGSIITSDLACDSIYQTYNWYPATGLSATNVRNPSLVLQPSQTTATYTLEYYNGCSCTSIDSIVIQVVEVDVNYGLNSSTQCGQDDAQIIVTALSGIAPFTYSIDNGTTFGTDNVFDSLGGGIYAIQVMDSSGCLSPINYDTIVEYVPPVIDSVVVSDETCYGFSDGIIGVFASSSNGSLVYSIDSLITSQTDSIFNGLADSSYWVGIEDTAGCKIHQSTVVGGHAPLLVDSTTSSNFYCDYDTSGTIEIFVQGGVQPYTYSVDGGNTFSNVSLINNLDSGNYSIVVRDSLGCETTPQGVYIKYFEPPQIDTVVTTDILCTNNAVGEISISTVMGYAPYQYSIDNGLNYSTSPVFTNLPSAFYEVLVMDSNGCMSTMDSAYIAYLEPPVIDSFDVTDETCYNYANGAIQVYASGGNGALSYSNNNLVSTQSASLFSNLADTTYWIVVEDTNGCSSMPQQVVVDGNPELVIDSIIRQNIFCFGDTTGEIQVVAQGGVAPYIYSINNGANYQNSPTFTQLLSGMYQVVVTDANLCSTMPQLAQITQSTPLSMNMQIDHDTCYDACGGKVSVQISGGVLPYSYNWYGHGSNQPSTSNLCAGNYQVRVTDSLGCTYDSMYTITQPTELIFSSIQLDPTSCNGYEDGGLTVIASGSVSPYMYSIDNGQNTTSNIYFDSLTSGNYHIVVYDSGYRCMRDTVVTVTQPTPLQLAGSFNTQTICVSNCIDLSVNLTGGNGGPYNYFWTGTNGSSYTENVCPQANSVYSVYATDVNNCISNTDSFTVNLFDSLQVTAFGDTAICLNEIAQISAVGTGGNPNSGYAYSWTPTTAVSRPNSASTQVSPQTTTTYIVRLSDGCGSPDVYDSVTITLYPEVIPSLDALTPLSGCEPLRVEFQNTTPSSQQVYWTIGDYNFTTPNVVINDLSTGLYDLQLHVISTDGCEGDFIRRDYINVNPLPEADFTMTPNPTTVFTPTVRLYDRSFGNIRTYNWNFAGLDSSNVLDPTYVFPVEEGLYPVMLEVVTDSECVDTTTRILVMNPEFNFYIPNAFSPNGDYHNDVFKPEGLGISDSEYSFKIYDRWGKLVFETNDFDDAWDGVVKDSSQEAGMDMYVWTIELRSLTGGDLKTYKGKVHLVR